MPDQTINTNKFKLPSYINIPFFLYQDSRLDKPALLIAGFFYSLHTSGQKITASTDYLCEIASIKKRQLYNIMNQLEECGYIQRSGFTNRKKLLWSYCPKSSITVAEQDTSAIQCTSDKELNTSALECTKLVHSSALNYCTPVHTDNKEDTKDYKKLTTGEDSSAQKKDISAVKSESSSSFFSQKQSEELLTYKIRTDKRMDEEFIDHCRHHIESQTGEHAFSQRLRGLINILTKNYEINAPFKASGYGKPEKSNAKGNNPPTKQDFDNWKNCVPGYEWVSLWRKQQG